MGTNKHIECCKYCGQPITMPALMPDIIRLVARELDIKQREIRGFEPRHKEITHARQLVAYLTRELTNAPWHTIGLHLGNRHHSTIIHGWRLIRSRMIKDRDFAAFVHGLEQLINPMKSMENPQDDTLPWIHFPSDGA